MKLCCAWKIHCRDEFIIEKCHSILMSIDWNTFNTDDVFCVNICGLLSCDSHSAVCYITKYHCHSRPFELFQYWKQRCGNLLIFRPKMEIPLHGFSSILANIPFAFASTQ